MNNKLPEVEKGHWIVLLIDSNTGVILDRIGGYQVEGLEKSAFVFSKFEDAVAFIKNEISSSQKVIEGTIYDSSKNFYKLIS